MKRILFLALGLIVSLNIYATTHAGNGQQWYGPFTIANVARYHDGWHRTTIHINEILKTPCSISNAQKMVSYYADNSDQYTTILASAAATAQAQNKKVMLLLDTATCNNKYGINLKGVEILSDSE